MSTNIIFTVPGRTTNYMPVDVNTSKEALLEKYARESFSTENNWPFDSPSAGYYDIKNSDTKLILLNKRMTWSHLRGKTKPKREPFIKDQYYDWVEKENEMKKQHEKNVALNRGKRSADPSRHFTAIGCTFKPDFNENSSVSFIKKNNASASSRPKTCNTVISKKEVKKKEDEEELLRYLYEISNRKTGLQDKTHVKNPPLEFLNSFNINHPDFSKGQKLYLNNLCQIYSVYPMKKKKQTQYLSLLEKQKEIDLKTREKFKMHDGENFEMYREFITAERPVPHLVNCGYFDPRRIKSAFLTGSKALSQERSVKSAPEKSIHIDQDYKKLDLTTLNSNTSSTLSFSLKNGKSSKSTVRSYNRSASNSNIDHEKEKNISNRLSDLSNTDYEKSYTSAETKSSESLRSSSESSKSSKLPDELISETLDDSKSESRFSLNSSSLSRSSKSRSSSSSESSTSSQSSKSTGSSDSSEYSTTESSRTWSSSSSSISSNSKDSKNMKDKKTVEKSSQTKFKKSEDEKE